MGAVRNLFVRIGGDASGAVKGFKDASHAGANAEKNIKKSTAQTKRSIREAFASSVPSIKEYTAQIAQTKSTHQTATQNVNRLKDEISRLTGIYDTVKNATAGLDLSKPLSELMVDAEKTLTTIESKRKKLETELRALTSDPKTANSKRTAALQAELAQLAEKSRFAQARMADLDRIADAVGSSNIGYASTQGLEQLQQKIIATENELRTTQMVANETGNKLKSMGVGPYIGQAIKGIGKAASQAAGTGVKKLWSGLKSLAGAAGRGIASIPSKLRAIGRSAASGSNGLGKMVRSIRNIGIASLGMKVAAGLFGRMRSIISNYISQNEDLSASVTSLRNQIGEALLPAINIVISAMQRLMPVVTKISNGINSIFKTLFGDIATTSKKIEAASEELNTYGFDQITKESDTESASTSSSASVSEQSSLVTKLTGWLKKLKNAFVAGDWKTLGATFAAGINSVFAALDNVDIGGKFGNFINAVTTTLHSLFDGIDFTGVGKLAGRKLTDAFAAVNWKTVGEVIGMALLMLPSLLTGFVLDTDWLVVGQSVSTALISALGTMTEWVQNTDWLKLGDSLADMIAGVDWGGIVSGMFSFFGAALGAGVSLLWGFLGDTVKSIQNYFTEKIEAAGGNVARGLLNGILDGLGNLGNWISKNVAGPFVKGFSGLKSAVVDVVEGMINSIIRGINKLLGGLNEFLSLGKKVGVDLSISTIPEVKLPRAAKGTIVSRATDLTVGEDGTEAIVPLEKHTEWIDVLAAKLTAKTAGGGSGGSAIFQFYLGNRKITEHVIKDINQITRENGVCPINV